MTKKPLSKDLKWIALTPRFQRNDFAGYNQKDGSHIFDNTGQIYYFVEKQAHDTLQAELDEAKDEIQKIHSIQNNYVTFTDERIKELKSRLERAESLLKDVKQDCRYVGGAECAIERIEKYFTELRK